MSIEAPHKIQTMALFCVNIDEQVESSNHSMSEAAICICVNSRKKNPTTWIYLELCQLTVLLMTTIRE